MVLLLIGSIKQKQNGNEDAQEYIDKLVALKNGKDGKAHEEAAAAAAQEDQIHRANVSAGSQ